MHTCKAYPLTSVTHRATDNPDSVRNKIMIHTEEKEINKNYITFYSVSFNV